MYYRIDFQVAGKAFRAKIKIKLQDSDCSLEERKQLEICKYRL